MQKDMVDILTAEGFTVNARELMRIRAKYKWFLRRPNGNILDLPDAADSEHVDLLGLADASQLDTDHVGGQDLAHKEAQTQDHLQRDDLADLPQLLGHQQQQQQEALVEAGPGAEVDEGERDRL